MEIPILVSPDDWDWLGDPPQGGVIKLHGRQTGGAMGMIEQSLAPGRMIRPHVHDHDVWLFGLSGETSVRVADQTVTAGPGSIVLKPRNVVHSIWNASSDPVRIMEIFTPAGFEQFMKEVSAKARAGTLTDDMFKDLCDRYGLRFFEDWPGEDGWVQKMTAQHNLNFGGN
ncbi:MAG TPA: cupin domain-containing protein [Actinomycetota bacterium]|nr:cupin domain-containing protein [Actinomycetota bacterium]